MKVPCEGPTPSECLEMEKDECRRLYGVRDTELNIATRVACHLSKGESNELTKRWVAVHQARDAQRQEDENRRAREHAAETEITKAVARIKKRYRL